MFAPGARTESSILASSVEVIWFAHQENSPPPRLPVFSLLEPHGTAAATPEIEIFTGRSEDQKV
jgi:hypothetical protein